MLKTARPVLGEGLQAQSRSPAPITFYFNALNYYHKSLAICNPRSYNCVK